MTREEINTSLHRNILSGKEYDDLFPSSTCKTVKLATGNTAVAIKEMAKWAKKYAHQTKQLAPIFAKTTLQETLNAIQWFLYWHIQYNIDGLKQNLKSPACAWETRMQGTDCKSYTIFASTILLNLGIKHYLRRIKQDVSSDSFTHVYVIIPTNQNAKVLPQNATFNNDYYILDGTIEINNELPFSKKDDIYMEPKLGIYGLAAPNALGCGCGCEKSGALNAPFAVHNEVSIDTIEDFNAFLQILSKQGIDNSLLLQARENMNYFLKTGQEPTIEEVFTLHVNTGLGLVPAAVILPASKFTLAGITKIAGLLGGLFKKGGVFSKLFGGIDCWGGTAFDANALAGNRTMLTDFFADKTEEINRAVFTGDLQALAIKLSEFQDGVFLVEKTYLAKRAWTKWNSCSSGNMASMMETVNFFKNTASKALDAWINEYFNVSGTTPKSYDSIIIDKHWMGFMRPTIKYTGAVKNLTLKSTTTNINGFELNENLIEQGAQPGGFNPDSYISSINKIVAIVDQPKPPVNTGGSNTGGSNTGGGNTGDGVIDNNGNTTPQKAGFGVVGAIIGVGIAFGAYQMSKNSKSTKPKE